jgi:hypothetical protein
MLNRTTLLSYLRKNPFGGRLSEMQVNGITRIVDYWETGGKKDERHLAYILATVFHETAHTMQPVTEYGTKAYLRSKPYWPWIGRGLVQITWKKNYEKFGLTKPEEALEWPTALKICFNGMAAGSFTGKKLSDYFNDHTEEPKKARAIINGSDKSGLIADYYTAFLGAIRAAHKEEAPEDVKPSEAKPDGHDKPLWQDPANLTVGSGVLTSILGALTNGWAVGGLAVILGALALGWFVYYRFNQRKVTGV